MSLVLKFGGTSVGDAKAIRQAVQIVDGAVSRSPLVVLSAMSGVTNALFDAARAAEKGDVDEMRRLEKSIVVKHRTTITDLFPEGTPDALARDMRDLFEEARVLLKGVTLLRELSPRTMDAVASVGERLSSRIFAAYAVSRGLDVLWLDARPLMRTDGRFGSARPQMEALRATAAEALSPRLAPGRVVVTQGYIGATEAGLTTTLGRGGSDYSAALFGAAIGAEEVQIWTDVEGILTADPRIVPEAGPIAETSFAEAAELAAFGAKVLHPATIQPAVEAKIPVTVRHTMKPDGAFTTISSESKTKRAVTALATRGPVTVLTVTSTRMLDQSGFLARLFEVFGRMDVSVDLVATAEVSVSLTVEKDAPIDLLRKEIAKFANLEVVENRAIVAIVGERLKKTPGLTQRAFAALGSIDVEMISMGANEINLSFVVKKEDAADAMRRLHKEFFESAAKKTDSGSREVVA